MTPAPRSRASGVTPVAEKPGVARAGRHLGALYSGIWLIWLFAPLVAAWKLPGTAARCLGAASILAFSGVYLALCAAARKDRVGGGLGISGRLAALWLMGLTALSVLVMVVVGEQGLTTVVYLAVCTVMLLPVRLAVPLVLALATGSEILSRTVNGWTESYTLPLLISVAAFAVWGVTQLMNRNQDLLRAREENARLAVEEERNRLARDLHDILGHSLTVITVKAELAGRLMDIDPERARAEVADLERLSRDALVDVRRSVEGYRELSLPGELARAREALRAAEIEGDLPTSAELVPSELRELFGWAVREGVTNVIRHSGARRCSISLTTSAVEIQDNGAGCPRSPVGSGDGHGLLGLRERANAAGAFLVIKDVAPHGFSLAVVAGGQG